MRPIKLVMKAFGPYADVEVIDFRELKDKNMFLIHGRTGSGKTTILDGICYALYGDTSGKERDGKSMRSQFAHIETLTEVELEFDIRGKRYFIHRIPQQERPKKVGEGFTIQNTEATLWRIKDGNKEVVETMASRVDEKIKEIIGFESSQFRQVIMIPQGQFRQLLTAKSEERQEILAKIFKTQDYKNVESRLKSKAKDLKNIIDKLMEKEKWILGEIKNNDSINLEELIKNNSDISLIIDKIKQSISEYEEKSIEVNKNLLNLEKKLKISQENLNMSRQNNDKINEKIKLESKIKEEEGKKELIEEKSKRIENARKAKTLLESEKILKNRSQEKKETEDILTRNKKELLVAKEELDKLKVNLKEEESKEEYRSNLHKRIIELESYYDKVDEIENIRKDLVILKENYKSISNEKIDMKSFIDNISNEIDRDNRKLEKINKLKDKYHDLKNSLEKNKENHRKLSKIENFKKEFESISREYNLLSDKFSSITKKLARAKEEYEDVYSLWNKGQAGILAKSLKEDYPCPVCGSTHHPNKAIVKKGVPNESDVKYKKDVFEHFQDQRETCKEKYDKLLVKKNNIENTIKDISKEVESNKDCISLEKEIKNQEKSLLSIEDELKTLDKLTIKINNNKTKLEEKTKKYKKIEKNFEEISNKVNIKMGALNQLQGLVPPEVNSNKDLDDLIKKVRSEYSILTKKYEEIKKAYDNKGKEISNKEASIDVISNNLENIVNKYNDEKKRFKDSLVNAGFKKYADFDNSKLRDDEIKKLEEEIISYRETVKSLKDRYEKLVIETKNIKLANLDKLKDELDNIQKLRDENINIKNDIKNKISTTSHTLKEIIKNRKDIKRKEDKYKVIGKLSEVANGKNIYGLTFERFVLSALLDDIISAANLRLLKMSSGRYELNRTLERDRKNAQGGLELEVFDNDTGMTRHVSTLSGGEGFKASLSLALGLADVVQSYSGGISLDTIFIDEGFGTLDSESLDYAIKTLIDLQKDGRLVGIISHVPELKERIDARLEVVTTQRGSLARFKVM